MSHVKCRLSHITYHLSLMPTAMDPHPANSPTMHRRLVCKDPKTNQKNFNTKIIKTLQKGVLSFQLLAISSFTRSFFGSGHGWKGTFLIQIFIWTSRLLDWIDLGPIQWKHTHTYNFPCLFSRRQLVAWRCSQLLAYVMFGPFWNVSLALCSPGCQEGPVWWQKKPSQPLMNIPLQMILPLHRIPWSSPMILVLE